MPSLGGPDIFDIFCPVARLITNLRGKGGVGQLLLVHLPQPGFDQILALEAHSDDVSGLPGGPTGPPGLPQGKQKRTQFFHC